MKVLLDIENKKAPFFMEVLKNFKYVKANPIVPAYARVIEELKEAVKNMQKVSDGKLKPHSKFIADLAEAFHDVKLYEQGKKKLKSAKDLLNEL